MTHEFKTPIATISLAVDAMRNEKVLQDREKLSYFSNIIKEENKMMNVQAGLQYVVATALYASLGINSATASPCIMLGWQWKAIRICLAGSMHPQLGATTGLSVQFFGKKKKDE